MVEFDTDFPRISDEHLKQFVIDIFTSYRITGRTQRFPPRSGGIRSPKASTRMACRAWRFMSTGYARAASTWKRLESSESAGRHPVRRQQRLSRPPMSYRAMGAVSKAKESGVCLATVGHSNHYGIAGYYATMALEKPAWPASR
ncbi:MAG: hypothetical protein R3A46_07625 [Thermomicrobiales bacterium]